MDMERSRALDSIPTALLSVTITKGVLPQHLSSRIMKQFYKFLFQQALVLGKLSSTSTRRNS
jgi:predicted lipid carrier protein YhbT